jgi:hypothetical protein
MSTATDDRAARRSARERNLRTWLVTLLAWAIPDSDARATATAPEVGAMALTMHDGRIYRIAIQVEEVDG